MNANPLEALSDFSDDERLIAEAVREARHVQEFIWGKESRSQKEYDAEAWRAIFQKRVDAISRLDFSTPGASVELRKRLLQQAALSIKAMVALRRHGLSDSMLVSSERKANHES